MHSSEKNRAIDAFVSNIIQTRFDNFDADTVELAKNRIIDVLGCVIGGVNTPGNKALLELFRNYGGKAESTIFIHGDKAPAQNVAMYNTIMARSYDFEVMSYEFEGKSLASHHAATLVPTAIALSEVMGASGKEMLTAMIVGDDIAARVQAASAGHPIYLGWDGCGTLSHLGATATASRLLGLSEYQAKNALGIVLNMIASAIQSLWDGATTFKLGQGIAARNGIFSAELAKSGWTGVEDALLSRFGYFFLYAGGCKDPEILTKDLGKKYYGEAYFKPYPCGMPNHPAIDAALALVQNNDINIEKVKEIIIHVPFKAIGTSYYAKPFEIRGFPHGDAIFSYPYTVCTTLLNKSCNLYNFTEEAIHDPAVNTLTSKTKLVEQPEGIVGIKVEVKMQDGTNFTEFKPTNRDWLKKPWPKVQILAKFWHQVEFSKTIDQKNARTLLDQIDNLERVEDIRDIVDLLIT